MLFDIILIMICVIRNGGNLCMLEFFSLVEVMILMIIDYECLLGYEGGLKFRRIELNFFCEGE